jgi:hypothetical protein
MINGYYLFEDKVYYDREEALDDMYNLMINKINCPPIRFKFHEEIFRAIDWTIDPPFSLKELYTQRAKQLRDTYDYLILSYSGGSDSHEILCTFLENNIFIDEIQVIHYEKAMNSFDRNDLKNIPGVNQFLEYEMVCVPTLEKVKQLSPKTKINTIDMSDNLIDDVLNNKFTFMGINGKRTQASFVIQMTPYARNFYQHHYNNLYIKKTNKTGFIRGVEKPRLTIKNNRLLFNFNDTALTGDKLIRKNEIDPIYTIENFFWSKDSPLIPIKQSHVLKKAFENDKPFYTNFIEQSSVKTDIRIRGPMNNYEREYAKYIYYHWHSGLFNAPKVLDRSPEFNLVSLIQKNNADDALKEQQNYYLNKYRKLDNRNVLSGHLGTEPYIIGELNVKWN